MVKIVKATFLSAVRQMSTYTTKLSMVWYGAKQRLADAARILIACFLMAHTQ